MQVMIRDAWDSYKRQVLPLDAHPTQVSECRRAFYAGAWAILNINVQIGEDSVTEDQGVAILDGLLKEGEAFSKDVQRGRA